MNYTPLKIMLKKDHDKILDLTMLAASMRRREHEHELEMAHMMLGLLFLIICYAFRTDIYTGFSAAVQAASGLVNYIKSLI